MPVPRTAQGSIVFATYNTLDLFLGDSPRRRARHALVVEAIRDLGADVLAVQEIRAGDEETAARRLRQLADETGLECLAPGAAGAPARPALAAGAHGYHLGLLWRPGIEPVPGSLRPAGRDFWHGLGWITLDVGTRVRHATYHAPPFGRNARADEAELVAALLARSGGGVPALVGADWNGESADRVPAGSAGGRRLYEPKDPFAGVTWFADMAHQCGWDYDRRGRRRHWADRRAGEALWAGGLRDAAAALRAPWQATTGHYPDDRYGVHGVHRRIDGVRVTAEVVAALRGHHVADTERTRRASDHLPVAVEYVPSAITAGD